jgi:hypothetical protein
MQIYIEPDLFAAAGPTDGLADGAVGVRP